MRKYIKFRLIKIKPKTNIYEVVNSKKEILGKVYWHVPWRQYIFDPEFDTIWSKGCMGEICDFIKGLMDERKKKSYDFSDIKLLRNLLSNEKSRILYALKSKNPKSIYQLAKILGRDFKSVREDVKVLERFGFIEFHAEKTGNRESLKPVLIIDRLQIQIEI